MKVINIFGGPGVGKSTIACSLFVKMKMSGFVVEYVDEYAKEKTYEKEFGKLGDQLYILAKQHRKFNRLRGQVDWAVTDSPLLMSAYYNMLNLRTVSDGLSYSQEKFLPMVEEISSRYTNINFFLERNPEIEYQSFGRNQTEEEALRIDNEMKSLLDSLKVSYIPFKVGTPVDILFGFIKNGGGNL